MAWTRRLTGVELHGGVVGREHSAARWRPTRHRVGRAVGLIAAALALAACGPPTPLAARSPRGVASGPPASGAVANGRYIHQVRISGLLVTPAPAGTATEHLGLTWQQAATLFGASSTAQGSHTGAMLGYGLVTLTGSALPTGTPRLDRRGAWVGILWGGGAVSCPINVLPSATPSAPRMVYRPVFTAVVIYGAGGDGAIVYTSRGTPPCGGPPVGPALAPAQETISVPWQQAGPLSGGTVRVRYRAPACAALAWTSASGNVRGGPSILTVDVTAPFDRSGCRAIAVRTTTVELFPPPGTPGAPSPPPRLDLVHGRTGLVAGLAAGRVAGAPG